MNVDNVLILIYFVFSLAFLGLFFWGLFVLIKKAVRDGIRESGLLETLNERGE